MLVLLLQSAKDASAKAADADKKRQQLTKSEDDLALQIAQLRKENEELKARRAQMSAQAKHASARVAALEKSDAGLQLKLRDALTEIESARKSSREHQFRIKQLQEELVFLEKRKRADAAVAVPPSPPQNAAAPASASGLDESDVPSWMKD